MAVAETYKSYASTVWERVSALATWQPDVQLAIGDVVSGSTGGVVTRETTLTDLGVSAGRLRLVQTRASAVRLSSGVSMSVSATGAVPAVAKARASFEKQSSFLVVTEDGVLESIENMAGARAVVEELRVHAKWKPTWHLVTSVRRFPACTIVIAKSAGVAAQVTVDLSVATGLVPDAIKAGAGVSIDSDQASQWVMPFECTPLYEAVGLRRRWRLGNEVVDKVDYLSHGDEPSRDEDFMTWKVEKSTPNDLGIL